MGKKKTQKWQKNQKFSDFNVIKQFLSNFWQTSWIKTLETLNMALIRCPVGLSEEIIAVFHMKKYQIDTENDKIPKIFQFVKIFTIFCQIFIRRRGLECFKGSLREKLVVQWSFPKSLLHFFEWRCLKLTTKITKKFKSFPIFKDFMHFFRRTSWIETLKRVNKEGMCCPVVFSEEFNAVF